MKLILLLRRLPRKITKKEAKIAEASNLSAYLAKTHPENPITRAKTKTSDFRKTNIFCLCKTVKETNTVYPEWSWITESFCFCASLVVQRYWYRWNSFSLYQLELITMFFFYSLASYREGVITFCHAWELITMFGHMDEYFELRLFYCFMSQYFHGHCKEFNTHHKRMPHWLRFGLQKLLQCLKAHLFEFANVYECDSLTHWCCQRICSL